jgi:hypothetical protein
MEHIITAEFNDIRLSIIDRAGKKWLTAEQIGLALGYNKANARQGINNLYARHRGEFTDEDSCVINLMTQVMTQGQSRETRVFSATGCNKLGFFASTARAKEFRAWAARALASPSLPAPALPAEPSTALPGIKATRRAEREALELFVGGEDCAEIARRLKLSRTMVSLMVHGKYQFSYGAGAPECPPELIEAVAARHLAIAQVRRAAYEQSLANRYRSTANNQALADAIDRVGLQLQQGPARALPPQESAGDQGREGAR